MQASGVHGYKLKIGILYLGEPLFAENQPDGLLAANFWLW